MIPAETPHLQTAARTDPGMTGKNNEDRCTIQAFTLSAQDPTPVTFALIADGVGGKQGGEVAAEMAIEMITRAVRDSDAANPVATLMQAYYDSNTAISDRARADEDLAGMGTTATCAWVIGDKLFAAHVGNTRLYLLRDNQLRQISIDHTWVYEALQHGILTPEQTRRHPNAHIITRHLGAEKMIPDMRIRLAADETAEMSEANQGMSLLPGDLLFLCSDGLSDVVEDAEIFAALTNQSATLALDILTALANERGGPDNITTLILQVRAPQPAAPAAKPPRKRRHWLVRLAIYLLSAVILIALIVLGWGVWTLMTG